MTESTPATDDAADAADGAAGADAADGTAGGRGLPRRCYYSRKVHAHELSTLWADTWQIVGRESDLVRPGDYLTYTAGSQPLFVIRGDAGELRAMHNVCPHRGAPLLYARGSCAVVLCQYHGWCFERDGRLRDLPQPQLYTADERARLSLAPARVDTWGGFVFASAGAEGESLRGYLAGLPAFLEPCERSWHALEEIDRWSYEEPVNWKLAVESGLADGHPPGVGSRRTGRATERATGRHHAIVFAPGADDAARRHPTVSGPLASPSYRAHLFPNTTLAAVEGAVSMLRLTPRAPEAVSVEVTLYQTADQKARHPGASEQRRRLDAALSARFGAVRRLQQSARSPVFRADVANPPGRAVTHFHRVLAGYYADLRPELDRAAASDEDDD